MAMTMTASDYDRLLKTCLHEIEHMIERQVERAFETVPAETAIDDRKLPWIGPWPYICSRAEQKQLVIAALTARQWFKIEGPLWAQPLLLKAEDCYATFGNHIRGPDYRAVLRGRFGMHAREKSWDIERMTRFEVF